jgi:hypothetical protein
MGALYDAVHCGRIEIARLRRCLAGLPLPRAADGQTSGTELRFPLALEDASYSGDAADQEPGERE